MVSSGRTMCHLANTRLWYRGQSWLAFVHASVTFYTYGRQLQAWVSPIGARQGQRNVAGEPMGRTGQAIS